MPDKIDEFVGAALRVFPWIRLCVGEEAYDGDLNVEEGEVFDDEGLGHTVFFEITDPDNERQRRWRAEAFVGRDGFIHIFETGALDSRDESGTWMGENLEQALKGIRWLLPAERKHR